MARRGLPDYDAEAEAYDATRGGAPRAGAAAEAELVPRGVTAAGRAARLGPLPDQHVPRAEPTYRLRGFVRL